MAHRQKDQDELTKLMDRKMIELDKKLFQENKQKEIDRDATARRNRQETLEQELQLKKLANYKKSDFAKAEAEKEKQMQLMMEQRY